MFTGLAGISSNVVPWFFGEGYNLVAVLLKVMSILIIVMGLSTITGSQYLVSINKSREYSISIIVGMVSNIVLNLIMIPFWGALGAAIASVCAESIITIVQFYYVRNDFNILHIIKKSRHYLFSAVLMFAVLSLENKFFVPSILNTMIMIFTGAFCYFLILTIFKDELLFGCIDKVLKSVKRGKS